MAVTIIRKNSADAATRAKRKPPSWENPIDKLTDIIINAVKKRTKNIFFSPFSILSAALWATLPSPISKTINSTYKKIFINP